MPENDSGDGESWEDYENGEDELGVDEFLEALEEDALIGDIGNGGDVPETVDSERGMAEFLKKVRDWGMQDPITTPPWEEHAEKPLPPRQTNTGGQSKVAINEDAQIIRAAANDSSLSGAAQLAISNMGDVQAVAVDRLADAVGAMQEGLGGLEGHAVAAAAAAGGEDGQSIQGAASVATEAVNTAVQAAEQARGLADQLNAAIQGARQAAESALAASEQFRQTCDGIASKHGA